MPKRIQRQRTKGWRSPEGCIYVGRPTKWGNPFRVVRREYLTQDFAAKVTPYRTTAQFSSAEACVDFYRFWLLHSPEAEKLREQLNELREKDLSCWCGLDSPCHVDVLLELANR